MQRAFQKIICINAGFEVQAAGISLQRSNLGDYHGSGPAGLHSHITEVLSYKSAGLCLCVTFSVINPAARIHCHLFFLTNESFRPIRCLFLHGAEYSLGNQNSPGWKTNWSNILGVFGPDVDCIFFPFSKENSKPFELQTCLLRANPRVQRAILVPAIFCSLLALTAVQNHVSWRSWEPAHAALN